MNYSCIDRGSSRCPCNLMEAGQCYTCGMTDKGKCSCFSGENWTGVCPYNEYVLNGNSGAKIRESSDAEVIKYRRYSDRLAVIRLETERGFAQKCSKPGAYIMVESMGFYIPISILDALVYGESYIDIALQPAGPKTKALISKIETYISKKDDTQAPKLSLRIKGPFFSGLQNVQLLDEWKRDITKDKKILMVGKGTAIAPMINCLKFLYGQWENFIHNENNVQLIIDTDKLNTKFLQDYLGPKLMEKAWLLSLYTDMDKVIEMGKNADYILLLTSPYYTEIFLSQDPYIKDRTISANHANICCGIGLCGSCSYVDDSGTTVKKCKCISEA